MERAAEWYACVTLAVVGLSHIVQPRGWVETYATMHRLGKPGAFLNGGLSLVPGAAFVAAHPGWTGPGAVLTLFGWLLILKGSICLLIPSIALRGMGRAGAGNGREFIGGGAVLLGVAGVLGYSVWG